MKQLTNRQRQVLRLAAGGNTTGQIALRLQISSNTATYKNLGAHDRAHAVALAIWRGDISLADLAAITQPASQQQEAAA